MYIHIGNLMLRTVKDISCNTIKMHLYSGNGKFQNMTKILCSSANLCVWPVIASFLFLQMLTNVQAFEEMLKLTYAKHCQTSNFAVQTLFPATAKPNGPLSAHLHLFTRVLRRLYRCWPYCAGIKWGLGHIWVHFFTDLCINELRAEICVTIKWERNDIS